MTELSRPRRTVNATGTATLRQRPALLLMLHRVRAAEATLELGLAEVKRQAADAARRLTRLGAGRVWTGEPHADDHANPDPAARMRAAFALRRRPSDAPPERTGVNIAVAATWELGGRSAEEVLVLVDQLRFDATADADPSEPPAILKHEVGPADQLQQIQQMMARTIDPPEDRAPKFVYIARPSDEQLSRAAAEAYAVAHRRADLLARAAGHTLGEVGSLSWGHAGADGRTDRLMDQQRCSALLSACGYDLSPGEVVSEDPRTVEMMVSVHATFNLEP